MRKSILFAVVLLFSGLASFAQEYGYDGADAQAPQYDVQSQPHATQVQYYVNVVPAPVVVPCVWWNPYNGQCIAGYYYYGYYYNYYPNIYYQGGYWVRPWSAPIVPYGYRWNPRYWHHRR